MFGLLKGIASKALKLVTGRTATALTTVGAGVAAGTIVGESIQGFGSSVLSTRRRRRRSKRFTNADFAELTALKAVVGPRSPLVLIRGLKMIR